MPALRGRLVTAKHVSASVARSCTPSRRLPTVASAFVVPWGARSTHARSSADATMFRAFTYCRAAPGMSPLRWHSLPRRQRAWARTSAELWSLRYSSSMNLMSCTTPRSFCDVARCMQRLHAHLQGDFIILFQLVAVSEPRNACVVEPRTGVGFGAPSCSPRRLVQVCLLHRGQVGMGGFSIKGPSSLNALSHLLAAAVQVAQHVGSLLMLNFEEDPCVLHGSLGCALTSCIVPRVYNM
jgi:hypothetical protein